jgi:hypothetical protein
MIASNAKRARAHAANARAHAAFKLPVAKPSEAMRELEERRTAEADKTERLRSQRLAKEAADAEQAVGEALERARANRLRAKQAR